jgi:hypothetical protein
MGNTPERLDTRLRMASVWQAARWLQRLCDWKMPVPLGPMAKESPTVPPGTTLPATASNAGAVSAAKGNLIVANFVVAELDTRVAHRGRTEG